MVPVVFELLLILLVLVGPALLAGRRFGMARAFGAFGISLILSGLAGLMSPYWNILHVKTSLGLSLVVWSAWIQFAPNTWSSFMDVLMKNSVWSGLVIVLLSTVAPFGNLEWLARFTTNLGLIENYSPLTTRTMSGDWRDHHVMDGMREQDPVLFWRSKAGTFPFSSQGFKTTIEMAIPKPQNVFRIMAYGDSNTEGTQTMDWPAVLHKLLQSRNTPQRIYEVVNAGVSGYSSYQGVQRFLQEWEKYQPDLIFVSFGWNDISKGIGPSDKSYRPKSPLLIQSLRALIQYRSYQVIQHYVISRGLQKKKQQSPLRVPLGDYLENMTSFAEVGGVQDIEVVFLTRPYRATTAEMLKNLDWRSRVPNYNRALSEFARTRGEHVIDVQRYFEDETEGLFMDETHFSEKGMTEMAQFLIRELDVHGFLNIERGNATGPSAQLD